MTKVTAICQECDTQFEYELKPGFPRKYCVECSEIKKASFAARQPTQDEKVKTVRSGEPEKTQPRAPSKEFHLSPEQVNTNALQCAITCLDEKSSEPLNLAQIIEVAKEFKEFIENGN